MPASELDCTAAQYRADPCETPSLSQSVATTLVTRSPAHAYCQHPRLGGEVTPPTPAQIEGTAIHALLLDDREEIEIVPYDSYRTKAAQTWRDDALAKGLSPVLEPKFTDLHNTAAVLREHIAAFGIALSGRTEFAFTWTEEAENGPVTCRGKVDLFQTDDGRVVDLKKVASADERTIMLNSYSHGYDIQYAAYTSGLQQLYPQFAGRLDFLFVFMELDPPYAVVPKRPDGSFEECGFRRWHRACETWAKCLKSGEWPAYASDVTPLSVPVWAIDQEAGEL